MFEEAQRLINEIGKETGEIINICNDNNIITTALYHELDRVKALSKEHHFIEVDDETYNVVDKLSKLNDVSMNTAIYVPVNQQLISMNKYLKKDLDRTTKRRRKK